MATLCPVEKCTSCLACYNTCPFDAISVKRSALSVLVPHIDSEKCRECGLCEKSCPQLSTVEFREPMQAIALYTRNDYDRATCASGGAASTFARYIIDAGGVVYGATAVGDEPRFIRVDSSEGIELLKGSKYVYCNSGEIYKSVKRDLDSGITCLFVGLPCNVAGLLKFLRKYYANLITIDLVCHGAPPAEYLKQHLATKVPKVDSIRNVTFRGKCDYHLRAYGRDDELLYSGEQYSDEYFIAFAFGWGCRQSCYSCAYAGLQRVSDITVGDFWGLASDALNGYSGKKSVALLNTPKGENLFKSVAPMFEWEQRTIQEAVEGNSQLRHATRMTPGAIKFHKVYAETGSLRKAFKAAGVYRSIRYFKLRYILLYIPKLLLRRK